LQVTGNVTVAETGETDSTLLALLYRNGVDSSVRTLKPDYIARVNAEGNFQFNFLPAGNFKIYILGDGDGSKTYNSNSETFAFLPGNQTISTTDPTEPLQLYAYQIEKKDTELPKPTIDKDKNLKLAVNLSGQMQDLLEDLILEFSAPL